jgi:F-type H+-transporting ATPase subunit epsilon
MSDTLQFELVTPERLAVGEAVAMVEVPGEMGDFGVLPGHAPFFSMIRPGVITVHGNDNAQTHYFVPSGYAEVNPDGCILLVEHARNLADVSKADAETELKAAKQTLANAEDAHASALAEQAVRVAEALAEAV